MRSGQGATMSQQNITETAIRKYIQEQSEEARKEDGGGASFLRLPVTMLVVPAF